MKGGDTLQNAPGCLRTMHEQRREPRLPVTRVGTEETTRIIDRNPGILGGAPVFRGSRVPVRILVEQLEAGDRLDEFLDDYPTVKREQAVALLDRTAQLMRNVE